MSGEPDRITDDGAAMVGELNYGHNPLAYLCRERPDSKPFEKGELCVLCADGFEALHWKRRALKAEARLAEIEGKP